MKNLCDLTSNLYEACGVEKFLFCVWTPADPDSTTLVDCNIKLQIFGVKGYNQIFNINPDNALLVATMLTTVINEKNIMVVGYNFKNLYTLFGRLCGKNIFFKYFYDLYWYESYNSLPSSVGNIGMATKNFITFTKDASAIKLYKLIYMQLIQQVVPALESFILRHDFKCVLVYPNYVVEGQENGRLLCNNEKKYSYNPHSLGGDKSALTLPQKYTYFMQMDYKNMEVAVLAEIANDENLLKIVNNSEDVYADIFYKVTGDINFENAREFGKKMFLPVIYGQTANSLSKVLDISLDQSEKFINNLREQFPASFHFVEKSSNEARSQGFCLDYFGRKRIFDDSTYYKARNFVVQSPASLICLYYLVKLYKGAKNLFSLVFHVHDGYFMAISKENLKDGYKVAKNILESENELIPSLKLKVSSKIGLRLDNMQSTEKHKGKK
jgi:hypothetical protein